MEVSDSNGKKLLNEVANLTGLPEPWVQAELHSIVETSGHAPTEVTLDELRASMLAYLESMQKEVEEQELREISLAAPGGSFPRLD